MKNLLHGLLLPVLFVLSGCGANPVAGGTKGRLQAGTAGLGDIQLTVHHLENGNWRPLGFGVTDYQGKFELVQNRAQGPLWLSPGDYRCTLQSAGAPVAIPDEFSQPETTPLQTTVKTKDDVLDLKSPDFPVQQ
jgi:hypothetical protein